MPRAFLSSTFNDLELHRGVAARIIDQAQWRVEWMENFPGGTSPTVVDCRRKVAQCDLLILIVAFRYGWTPADSDKSCTWHEVDEALKRGIPVRALMCKTWNVELSELTKRDPAEWKKLEEFRTNWNSIAEFFEHEKPGLDAKNPLPGFAQLVRKVMNDHRDRVYELKSQLCSPHSNHWAGGEFSLPLVLNELHDSFDGRVWGDLESLRQSYQQAHPNREGLADKDDAVSLFVRAVKSLAWLPYASGGEHPLPSFLKHLANCVGGERGRLLLGCLAKSRQSAGEAIHPIPPRPSTVNPPETFLEPAGLPEARQPARVQYPCRIVVCYEPALTNAEGFKVSAWMGDHECLDPLPLEQEIWTLANRGKRLAELHEEILRRNPPFGNTVLEFVVPRSLISEEFDQWQMDRDEMGYIGRLIDNFPVIVRSHERVRSNQAMARLRWRWQQLQEELKRPCQLIDILAHAGGRSDAASGPRAIWVSDQRIGDQLFRTLNVEQSILCALLSRAPKSKFSQNTMDVFKALLLSGVPFMLWPRKAYKSQGLQEELTALVEEQCLEELSTRVHAHRHDVSTDKLTSRHLTFIWDDPTKPVPEPDNEPFLSPVNN